MKNTEGERDEGWRKREIERGEKGKKREWLGEKEDGRLERSREK